MSLCICNSGKSFSTCCERFIHHAQYPKTPEQLMRSRFTAFKLGGYGEYLMRTWLPVMTKGLSADVLSQPSCVWKDLEIIHKSQKGDDGFVEFKASFTETIDSLEIKIHHEHSIFKRINGKWLYVGYEPSGSNH